MAKKSVKKKVLDKYQDTYNKANTPSGTFLAKDQYAGQRKIVKNVKKAGATGGYNMNSAVGHRRFVNEVAERTDKVVTGAEKLKDRLVPKQKKSLMKKKLVRK